MIKGRKVGTLTSGIILVVFGIMFLLRLFINNLNILFIASLWPVILILLGIEIIAAYIINKEEKLQYDFAGVTLVIVLVFFAMGMGSVEFIINNLMHFHVAI